MKDKNFAEINSSYTVFFVVSTIVLGVFFGSLFPETKHMSILGLILYSALMYFMWDFIRQLYSPGQAFLLYTLAFLILPFILNWFADYPYARLGSIVFLGSLLVAGVFELIYEFMIKARLPKNIQKSLFGIDGAVDKNLTEISNKHVYLTEYRGFIFALALLTAYYTFMLLIFHR